MCCEDCAACVAGAVPRVLRGLCCRGAANGKLLASSRASCAGHLQS